MIVAVVGSNSHRCHPPSGRSLRSWACVHSWSWPIEKGRGFASRRSRRQRRTTTLRLVQIRHALAPRHTWVARFPGTRAVGSKPRGCDARGRTLAPFHVKRRTPVLGDQTADSAKLMAVAPAREPNRPRGGSSRTGPLATRLIPVNSDVDAARCNSPSCSAGLSTGARFTDHTPPERRHLRSRVVSA